MARRKHAVFVGFALGLASCEIIAQDFKDLGFESASFTLPDTPIGQYGSFVPATDAFRGVWKSLIGGVETQSILQNNLTIGSPAVGIFGPNYFNNFSAIDGQYTAVLTGSAVDAALSQVGTIPSDANSLLFRARTLTYLSNGPLIVSIGTSTTPIISRATAGEVTDYVVDVSQWKGTVQELKFTAASIEPGVPKLNVWEIDSIAFSSQQIPEPQTWSLLLLGVFGFKNCWRRVFLRR